MASKQLITYSLQRSGHNAIIKWLLYQNENVDKFREWTEWNSSIPEECFFVRYGSYTGFHIAKPDMGNIGLNLDFCQPIKKARSLIDTLDGDLIIQNHADLRLPKTVEQNETVVVILRDWRNYIASHMKHTSSLSVFNRVKTDIFKEYANELLKQSIFYPILFDAWFASKNYRIKICQDLGLYFTDIGKQSVPPFGKGSSFDELRFDGEAEKMDVLNRYKVFEESPDYQKFMDDTEAVELNNKILYRFMK